jgi:hypothetical protein
MKLNIPSSTVQMGRYSIPRQYLSEEGYAIVPGSMLGQDNNYNFAVHPDGSLEHAIAVQTNVYAPEGSGLSGTRQDIPLSVARQQGFNIPDSYDPRSKSTYFNPNNGMQSAGAAEPYREKNNFLWDTLGPAAFFGAMAAPVAAAGFGAGPLAGATGTTQGTAAAGGTAAGTGGTAAAGGAETALGSGITTGAGGVTGITSGAAGAGGLSAAGASGALAPGFFAAETAYPVIGGAAAAGGATALGSALSGSNAATNAAAAGAGSTAAGRIIRGQGTLEDYLSVGGTLGATGLSIYGNQQTADKYDTLARDYMSLGAPSRQRYEASFDPNFDITKLPGLQGAMDVSSQSLLRQLSTQGNPYGNPGGLIEAQKYLMGNLALPALQNYRNQNAATGGFGAFSTAAPQAAGNAITAGGNMYSDIGRGLGNITNPPTSLEQILKQLKGTGSIAGLA